MSFTRLSLYVFVSHEFISSVCSCTYLTQRSNQAWGRDPLDDHDVLNDHDGLSHWETIYISKSDNDVMSEIPCTIRSKLVHLNASRKNRNVTCVFVSSDIHDTEQISATSKCDSGIERHGSGLSYPDFSVEEDCPLTIRTYPSGISWWIIVRYLVPLLLDLQLVKSLKSVLLSPHRHDVHPRFEMIRSLSSCSRSLRLLIWFHREHLRSWN